MAKERFYPFRNPDVPSEVNLIPISEKQFQAIYPEIWSIRSREQEHGRCMCPRKYLWKCDADCLVCEYHAAGDTLSQDKSLADHDDTFEEPLPYGEFNLTVFMSDVGPSVEEIVVQRDLLKRLITRFRELDKDADQIIRMRLDDPKISDRKIAETLGRPQTTFSYQIRRCYKELLKEMNK